MENEPKYAEMVEKYTDLEAQFNKDKAFYEQALETRTDQLESKEEENEKLTSEKAD